MSKKPNTRSTPTPLVSPTIQHTSTNAALLTESQRLSFSLHDWLDWQLSLHTQEIDLGLARISEVAARLGVTTQTVKQQQPNNRIITIAGTNGKGSCVATLEALLLAQSARVGAYTSPHLLNYNERIRVNGQPVSDCDICAAFAAIDRARGEISLTFFEFGTLAALYVFHQHKVDFWLLEVGLGGRLDAVNIMDADVAVVTSIDIDHVDWLGDDRSVIGREKAGVFRSGKPAICADVTAPNTVYETAKHIGAEWQAIEQAFAFSTDEHSGEWTWRDLQKSRQITLSAVPALPEPSVAAALMVLQNLEWLPEDAMVQDTLGHLSLAGRNQQMAYPLPHGGAMRLRLDVAHNPAASELLSQRLSKDNAQGTRWALLAMMADKDVRASLKALLPFVDQWLCVGLPDQPRAMAPSEMKRELIALGVEPVHILEIPTVGEGVQRAGKAAIEVSVDNFELLVTGSFFTVAAVLALMPSVNCP